MKDENVNKENSNTYKNNQPGSTDILNQEFFNIFKTQKKIS